MEKLLQDKIAVVYGAGSIGSAIAHAFAGEGAKVFIGARSDGRAGKLVATLAQVGYMADFMASDKAGCTSGTFANLTGGIIIQ